jgi:hypothetical protein
MSKVIQMILSGIFFTFILDFFIFLGIKQNYIDPNNIGVYYNILFADHQNIYIFIVVSLLVGFIVMYLPTKITLATIGTLFLLSLATLVPSLGKRVGETLLMKKDITISTNKFTYHGDLLYDGRKKITFYDYELKKDIILDKNKIKQIKGNY